MSSGSKLIKTAAVYAGCMIIAVARHPTNSRAANDLLRRLVAQYHENDRKKELARLEPEMRRIVEARAREVAGRTPGARVVQGTYKGYPAQIEYGQKGDKTRIEIYYGDLRELTKDHKTNDKTKYGHIVIRNDTLVSERVLGNSAASYNDDGCGRNQ